MLESLIHLSRCFRPTRNYFYIAKNFSHFSRVQKPLSSNLLLFSDSQTSLSNRKYMDLTSVVKILERHLPSSLAEKWDNTGLLVEPVCDLKVSRILFTNDLTENVVMEAISQKSNMIISYHPPIFAPVKALKQSNWKDRILMLCIQNNIAIYSPHTSCDAVAGGVNDWLINCFSVSGVYPIIQSYQKDPKFTHMIELSYSERTFKHIDLKSRDDIVVISESSTAGLCNVKAKGNENAIKDILLLFPDHPTASRCCSVTLLQPLPLMSSGMGRIGALKEPLALQECIDLIKRSLNLEHIRFAKAVLHHMDSPISKIAVCAGSGASVLKGVAADLYITGEMSHHDILDAAQRNISVVLCEHSNSERGYLQKLVKLLSPELENIELIVSECDRDPISIV